MYAVIGYKRPDLAHEGKVEVAFEIRSLGCFNGLNCLSAFTVRPQIYGSTVFDVVLSNVEPNGELPGQWFYGDTFNTGPWGGGQRYKPEAHLAMTGLNEDRLVIANNGDNWECIGLGWLSFTMGQFQSRYEPPYSNPNLNTWAQAQAPRYQGGSPSDAKASVMLSRNTIAKEIYDHWSGDNRVSYRKCTPNERFMRSLYHSLAREAGNNFRNYYKGSRVLNGIMWNQNSKMLHFEFVGSERPSGLAVSYLQIYRNAAEKLFVGDAPNGIQPGIKKILGKMYDAKWPMSLLDPVPLISMMVHHGGDSDIVNFAGNSFVGYSASKGLLECAYLYGNTSSMLTEGRYTKGNQSSDLRGNLARKISGSKTEQKFEEISNSLHKITQYIAHQNQRPDIDGIEWSLEEFLLGSPNATPEQLADSCNQQVASQVTPWVVANVNFKLPELVKNIMGVLREGVPNFRPKPEKAKLPQLSGKALGFSEWVRQAEGQQAELGAAESVDLHASVLSATSDTPEGAQPETPVDWILAEPTPWDQLRYRDAQGRFATRH